MSDTAYIFPAFVLKYLGSEINILNRNGFDFRAMLRNIEKACEIPLVNFDIQRNNMLDKELETQLLTYTISCGISDILKKKANPPEIVSGFSMGIYAALYHLGSISFIDGASLICRIFNILKNNLTKSYKMISVIGFELSDLKNLLSGTSFEIVITNGTYSFVIAGYQQETEQIKHKLTEEGAIHLLEFEVNLPYHSSYIGNSKKEIKEMLTQYKIEIPGNKYISMIDQQIITTPSKLKDEISQNLFNHLDFQNTAIELSNHSINQCFECGPGDSLTKSSKFIDANLKFYSLKKYAKLLLL